MKHLRLWYKETNLPTNGKGNRPFPYQEELFHILAVQNRPLIINKARQTGISTLIACIGVMDAILKAWPVLIVSNREENAAHILEYGMAFSDSIRNLGIGPLPKVETDKVTRLTFSNGGELRCLSANPSTARGYPAKRVFFDEFAHFKGESNLDKKMLEAVAPSISQVGGTLVLLSTPYGKGNEFSRMWDKAPLENCYIEGLIPTDVDTLRFGQGRGESPLQTMPSPLKVRIERHPYGDYYWIEGSPAPIPKPSFLTEYCNDFEAILSTAIPSEALWAKENIVQDDEAWE